MAFKHSISFATVLAANFGCNQFRIMLDIASQLLHTTIWICCAVLFESEQIPFPRTGCWLGFAALHRIQFGMCNFVPILFIFLLRVQWMTARLSKAMGKALVGNNFWPIPLKILFYMKKSDLSLPYIYKAIKPFWLWNWVSIARVVACFPQASLPV